jgi:photosystem II stability/assembly factor-like uncharacterized protein
MQVVRVASLSLLVTLCLGTALSAQQPDKITSLKLLAPDIGWAASSRRLYWTASGGGDWTDVTPKTASPEDIASVFFLDVSHGWALLATSDQADSRRFDLASTSNSGESWSITPVTIPDFRAATMTPGSDGRVDFVDPLHGWLNLGLVGGAAFRPGLLLATADGGKTWKRALGGSGTAGGIRFVTTEKGWVTCGDEIYATRDGAKSWQQFTLEPPAQARPAVYPTYDLPMFVDSQHGFLPVTYSGSNGSKSALVLFDTVDGGTTWKSDRILSGLKERSVGQLAPSAMADSVLVALEASDHTHLKLTTVAPGQKVATTDAEVLSPDSGILQLSFDSPSSGWALVADARFLATRLLRTADSGVTWSDITPHAKARGMALPPSPPSSNATAPGLPRTMAHAAANAHSPLATMPKGEPSGTPVHISTGLGFDQKFVGLVADMGTWWTYSPLVDVGFYANGGASHSKDPNLDANWVQGVIAQGWGLMPLWAGPQAPCACDPNLPPPCTHFPHVFSSNPTTAYSNGQTQANLAAASVGGPGPVQLNLPSTIIYYDMEVYNSAQCGPAVSSFVNGWDSQLLADGFFTGVYGSPYNTNDWASAATIPGNVWIAKYNNKVTTWGLSPLCDPPCSLWTSDQRIHQYAGTHSISYGGVAFKIDDDIEDAEVAGAQGSRDPGYSVTNFAFPGATITYVRGLNDEGQIFGFYHTCVGQCAFQGFIYTSPNDYISLTYPGATDTRVVGGNNLGQAVGAQQTGNAIGGFLYSGGTFSTVEYPGDVCVVPDTSPIGINDAGWIAGNYEGSDCLYHGFLLINGAPPVTIDPPGSVNTTVLGLNGVGQVAGFYYDANSTNTHGFIYSYPEGVFTIIDYLCQTCGTEILAINNNGTAVVAGSGTLLLYDRGDFDPLSVPLFGLAGLNDAYEIAGADDYGASYIATPQ